METISVFEHKPISLVGEDVPLKDIHLRQLGRLNRQAGVELVQFGYKKLMATSYVGVVQLGGVTLQILPKVDATGRDDNRDRDSVDSAVANLLWMLLYAGELPVRESEVASLLKRQGKLFEILVRIFCERLTEQLQRGLYRSYQRREDTLPVLKGHWMLGRQLREQPLLRAKFLVAYDEFIADNPLNRILCYTVHYLWYLTRDAGNRQRLDALRMWFDGVTLLPRVSEQHVAQVTFTRLNAAYRPAFNLACMFLAHEFLQLQAGRIPVFAFLFDMNLLFERFLVGFLRRHRQQALPETLQACEILAQGAGDPRWLARTQLDGGRRKFRLKPDLLLRRPDKSIALIIDTKYKTRRTIAEADAYQMHAYATRYECPDVVLLYPESGMSTQVLYIESSDGHSQTRLRTHTVNLRYDLRRKEGRDNLAYELAKAMTGE
jgi:5-methylcytosine-specific restriction enzyme subunit McrC